MLILKKSKQKVAALPALPGLKPGYTDVVIIGKPNNVCRVKETNLRVVPDRKSE